MTAHAPHDMAAMARSVRLESEIARRNIKLSAGTVERSGPCPVCGGTDRFSINVRKQLWNCRGCQCGGDIITLVRHLDGLDFGEAVRLLAGEQRHERHAAEPKKVAPERFDYYDETGALLYQVERIDLGTFKDGKREKKFSQRRPDGNGGWLNGRGCLDGVRRVPYRLPQLLESLSNGTLVVLAEGERKVDWLWSWNIAATCNSGGRGSVKNWARHARDYFNPGDKIVILPDNDEPGQDHANAAAASLKAVGADVRVLDLPGLGAKGDIIDWAEAGGTAEQFHALIASAARPWAASNGHDEGEAAGGFGSFVGDQGERFHEKSWPEPKPIESALPPVKPFTAELLPDALRDYVLDVADRQQAPPDFAAVAAICGLAALAGNRVRIRPKQNDDWEVVPNLWGAIIGRPSAMKSPAMRSALAPVYAIQDRLRKAWEATQRDAGIAAALSALDAKDAGKKAAKALKGGDREEAKRLLSDRAPDNGNDEIPCPRLIVNDATVEKLGELMNANPHGLLLVRDELPGFLAKMESEEYQSERAFYLEAFNGDGQFTYDRIGRGTIIIENCTLSIIGGVQPARIAPLVRGAATGVSDDGLIQRLQLTVWPDDIGSWKWTDRHPDAVARERYDAAFRGLHDFAREFETPAIFGFSSAAQDMFKQWMTEIQTEARSGKLPSVLECHILKMPKTVAALALIFELVDGGHGAIGSVAAARALDWADYLRSHAARLYSAGGVMAENGARLIVERRSQLPECFTARDVQRKAWAGLADRDTVAAAIELLIAAGYCREAPTAPSAAGGRPSVGHVWNPRVKVEG
jgi:hypothetical protein